ncbi:hypothetical protein [Cryobacterium sp. PAMC25264]|uniref:hypothetical protein n=1 Tax=Cryobacterium sp. PAMC25264 TaxID=2861288 RepID=UPI001C6381B1|nr:hypothetical protein [Cryobacterium sp. PAMC25264]QYF74135.1 hypothetical protein KY500_02535 [Cryobacterium sp. PAMC25264]
MTSTTETSSRCSLCLHDDREQIEAQLMAGTGVRELAAQHGVSSSAISRHSQRHLQSARFDAARDSAAAPADLLARLVNLADDARASRLRAATPNAQARASDTESRILFGLLGQLGVKDTTTVAALQQAERLTHAVAKYSIANPVAAQALIREIRHQGMDDFGDQLTQIVNNKNSRSTIERTPS